ncbi:MAG: UDP-N-acetylmuramate dehydrogenase [Acidimicrobiaceae bacterium]|nr:UDP-N-acetylmuramate dehydrogenase [Acidimicrobiaceae bacterium]
MSTAVCDRTTRLAQLLADSSVGSSLLLGQSLARFNTYRTGGPAKLMLTVNDLADLITVARAIVREAVEAGVSAAPVLVLGRGSNLLVADRGFDGLVVMLGDGFQRFQIDNTENAIREDVETNDTAEEDVATKDAVEVTAGGGVRMPVLARACADAGLSGFEWAVGVPGTVGGAVRMNAGCHGSDISEVLVSVDVFDLESGLVSTLRPSDLDLDYRKSNLSTYQVVISVKLQLTRTDRGTVLDNLFAVVNRRKTNQPSGRNAGSVFVNPPNDSAGRLIESAGGKGLRNATAEVSSKHANFIQVDKGGCSRDVLSLMIELHNRVLDVYDLSLDVETRLVGFSPEEVQALR